MCIRSDLTKDNSQRLSIGRYSREYNCARGVGTLSDAGPNAALKYLKLTYAYLNHVIKALPYAETLEDIEALLPWNVKVNEVLVTSEVN